MQLFICLIIAFMQSFTIHVIRISPHFSLLFPSHSQRMSESQIPIHHGVLHLLNMGSIVYHYAFLLSLAIFCYALFSPFHTVNLFIC